MNNDTIIFIGLDTHKDFTEIAYSEYQREKTIEHFGRIKTTKPAIGSKNNRHIWTPPQSQAKVYHSPTIQVSAVSFCHHLACLLIIEAV